MIQNLINRIFRQEVLDLSAYKVAEAKNVIKLDAMENPYSWPEDIKDQWLKSIRNCPINRYPDAEAKILAATLKKSNQIPLLSEILLGNGSDEIIQLLLMALPSDACVMAPKPGFVMYKQVALSLGLSYQSPELRDTTFDLDLNAMLEAIKQHKPSVIFLAYPNNPTGNLFKASDIKSIILNAPGLVIVDEAYAPFAEASFIEHLNKYDNLLVMRTVSKLGLAGLRLGYLAGNKAIISQLNKIRLPYNINCLTQATATFALQNSQLFDQQTKQICKDRSTLLQALNQLPGITAFPSSANFILFKTEPNKANLIFAELLKNNILIKNLSPQGGSLQDCLRVTIGKAEENQAFLTALSKTLDLNE